MSTHSRKEPNNVESLNVDDTVEIISVKALIEPLVELNARLPYKPYDVGTASNGREGQGLRQRVENRIIEDTRHGLRLVRRNVASVCTDTGIQRQLLSNSQEHLSPPSKTSPTANTPLALTNAGQKSYSPPTHHLYQPLHPTSPPQIRPRKHKSSLTCLTCLTVSILIASNPNVSVKFLIYSL